jgi:hypothetical protein
MLQNQCGLMFSIVLFQVLTEPEKAAKRKIKKHLKKREAKKKRIEKIKSKRNV